MRQLLNERDFSARQGDKNSEKESGETGRKKGRKFLWGGTKGQ